MKKIIQKSRFMLLLVAMMTLSLTNAWGATSYEDLFTVKSDDVVTTSSYTKYETTVEKRDWVITFGGNNKSVGANTGNRSKCNLGSYTKYAVSPVTSSQVASAFVSKTSISDVSKISYTIGGGSNQNYTKVYLIYSSDNTTFDTIPLTSGTQGATIKSGTAYEFAKCSGYFGLLFAATNSSGNWRIDDVNITFYKEKVSDQVATPAFKVNDVTITDDAEYCGAQEVTISCSTDGAAISYSTDGGTNWTAYSTPIEVTATATLKAKATKTGLTDSDVNSKTFTINDPIANDSASAYTTADAIAKINANKCLTDTVFVKGTVSKVDKFNESYYSITYWLDSDAFEVYSGKGLNGANFTSIDDVKVGAEVVVKGIIKKFVSGSTTIYEFDKNNYLVAYKEPETPKTTATISLSSYKQTLAADDPDNVVTIKYNGDGQLAAESSDPNVASVALTVNETDTFVTVTPKAAGGPVTITVSAPETDNYTSASKYYTLNVTSALTAAALPFSFDGGKNAIDPANGIKQSGLGSDYSSSPKLKFDTQDDEVVIKVAEKAAQLTYTVKGNSFSGGTFDVLESVDGVSYDTLKTYTTLGDAQNDTVTPAAASRYFKFVYTSKSSGNVALGAINIVATLPKVDPTFSIANVDVINGGSKTLNITTNSTGAITYTIDPADVGKIAITDNVVYGYTDGNYTVGAEIAATDTYNAKQTSFNVTVASVAYKTAEYVSFTNLKDSLGQLGQYYAYKGGGTADAKVESGQIYLYQKASGKSFGGYITINALPGLKIAKIDFESSMGTTYNYKVDASNDYALTNNVDIEADDKETISSLNADSVRIYCLGTSKSYRLYLSYLKVYYSGELETVSKLAVAGATKTVYEIGEPVDHAGAVVTATFATSGEFDVTLNSTFTDPNMSTAGQKQVAANFAGNVASYNITVNEPAPATLDTIKVSGEYQKVFQMGATFNHDNAIVTAIYSDKSEKVVTNDATFSTPDMTTAGQKQVTVSYGEKSTYYTITVQAAPGTMKNEKVEFAVAYADLTLDQDLTKAQYNPYTATSFTISYSKGTASTNKPMFYVSDKTLRAYKDNTLTITGVDSIVFVYVKWKSNSYKDAGMTIEYNASAKTATLNFKNTCRITSITVYYQYDEAIRTGMSVGQVGTSCLTKNVLAVRGGAFYNVEYGNTQQITFKEMQLPIAAGAPALFQAEAAKVEVIYGEEVATEALDDDEDGFVGLLSGEKVAIPEGNIIINGGRLRLVGENCWLTAGHAYIDMSEVSPNVPEAPARGRRLILTNAEAQVVTGLNAVGETKLGEPKKVLLNGQIIIIRDAKMYNAQGQEL